MVKFISVWHCCFDSLSVFFSEVFTYATACYKCAIHICCHCKLHATLRKMETMINYRWRVYCHMWGNIRPWSRGVPQEDFSTLIFQMGMTYSQIHGCVKATMQVCILRSVSLCIWGSWTKWRGAGIEHRAKISFFLGFSYSFVTFLSFFISFFLSF